MKSMSVSKLYVASVYVRGHMPFHCVTVWVRLHRTGALPAQIYPPLPTVTHTDSLLHIQTLTYMERRPDYFVMLENIYFILKLVHEHGIKLCFIQRKKFTSYLLIVVLSYVWCASVPPGKRGMFI